MSDWFKLEAANAFPFRCVACVNAKDVLDTFVEVPGWGRVFICKNCARTAAREFGFSRGKEQERLSNAAEVLAEAEKERNKYKQQRDDLGQNLLQEVTAHEITTEENAKLRGRVAQLESRLRAKAEADLSLVGDDAA
jgi:hypothetical protein